MAASPSTSQPDLLAQSSTSLLSIDSGSPSDLISLAKDVDHIKELIGLSNAGHGEGITHSIFRRSSRVYVSQSQILKELDRLKRRLRKAESASPTAPADAVDPDNEDERDLDPVNADGYVDEVERLKSEIERVTKEREDWIEDAERRIDEATERQSQASQRAESSQKDLEDLKIRSESTESELGQLKVGFAVLKEQHEATQASLQEAQRGLKAAKDELTVLSEDHGRTLRELQLSQKSIKDLEIEHAETTKALEKVEQSFSNLTQTQSETQRLHTMLQSQLDNKSEENFRLSSELESSLDNITHLEKGHAETLKSVENVNKQVSDLKQENSEIRSQRDTKSEENVRLSNDLQNHVKDFSAARQKLDNQEAKASEYMETISKLKVELASLTEKASQDNVQLESEKKRVHDAEDQVRTLTSQLENEQRTSADKLQEIQNEKADLERSLREERADLGKKTDSLSAELADSIRHLQDARKESTDAEGEVQKLRNQLDEIKKSMSDAEDRARNLQQLLQTEQKTSGEQLQKAQNDIAGLQHKLTEEKTSLGGKLADLTAELADSFQQLQGSQKDITEAKSRASAAEAEHKEAIKKAESERAQILQALEESRNELLAKQRETDESLNTKKSLEETKEALTRDLQKSNKALEIARAAIEEIKHRSEQETKTKIVKIAKSHQAEISALQDKLKLVENESKARVPEIQAEAEKRLAEAKDKAANEAREAKATHERALADLQKVYDDEKAAAEKRLADAKEKTAEETRDAKATHERALVDLRRSHDDEKTALGKAHDEQKSRMAEDARKATEEQIERIEQEAKANMSAAQGLAAKELKEVRDQLLQDLENLKIAHASAMEKLVKTHDEKEELWRKEFAAKVADMSSQLSTVTANHHTELGKMENTHKIAFAEATKKHEDAYRDLQLKHDLQMAQNETQRLEKIRLETSHAERGTMVDDLEQSIARAQAEMKDKMEAHRSQLHTLHEQHAEEALKSDRRYEEAISTANTASAELLERHSMEMDELKQTHGKELQSLRQHHEGDLRRAQEESTLKQQGVIQSQKEKLEEVLKQLSKQHDERIIEMTKTHEVRLEKLEEFYGTETAKARGDFTDQLAQTNQSHAEELERQQQDYEERLQNMQNQLQSKLEEKEKTHTRKISEVEIKASQDAKVADDQYHVELEEMRLLLTAEQSAVHERFSQTLLEYQMLSDDSDRLAREITALREQRKRDEEQRQKKEAELDDQLIELRVEAEAARQQAETLSQANEALQNSLVKANEERDVIVAELKKQVAAATTSESKANDERAALAVQLERFLNQATHDYAQQSQSEIRNLQSQLEDSKEKPMGMSFEQYLSQAQTELSELGRVISQNEAVFAQKIAQHVGDLQMAKNQLALEYKQRFDDLVQKRQNLEDVATTRHTKELDRAKEQLKQGFAPPTPPSSSRRHQKTPQRQGSALPDYPSPDRVDTHSLALVRAETRLVAEHDTQLAKRKSQIALTHASCFAALTTEYDTAIARLFDDRDDLGGDLAISPDAFENTLSRMNRESFRLENERAASVGQRSPVTPFRDSGSQGSPGSFSAFHRQQNSSLGHKQNVTHSGPRSPSGQSISHSLYSQRPSSPPDGPLARRTVASPRSSPLWARPGGPRETDFGVAPEEFEVSSGRESKDPVRDLDMRSVTQSPSGGSRGHRHLRHASGNVGRIL